MNSPLIQGFIAIGLLLALEWKTLKKENRHTRWFVYGILGTSWLLWIYCSSAIDVHRPMVWLESLLEPLILVP
ncbi:hypothetical protein [Ammoniphilus sp. CFH 90114]|uniref:hypothetical protein n=1 Tax=Ammoniphilus sp. CFH 90114 TaxID=2493665 RepID=UPI00100DF319|nr:hypothetical protein [Ammoniphilus sp. CFH 90114]RXT03996.1 hypothetical protein EIZ39_21795 [Ammoniphilus sp. CFH 90114]